MPKRGNGRGRNWRGGENDHGHRHYEHDERGNENTRRVSFKPGTNNKFKNKQNRKWSEAIKTLDDIDVDMNATGSNLQRAGFRGGYRGREGRLNSPAPKYVQRVFQPGHSPWYQVTIPYGGKHDKDVVLKALLSNLSPDIFIPHYYKNIGNAAIFYVDDVVMAEKLFYVDRKITMPDGFKLNVKVRCGTPHINVDESLKEKMKLAMVKRYNPATKALDLTKFHADPELLDVFCALYRPTIMVAAMDIVAENISDLEALNLNDNKLHALDHLKGLSNKLKKLKILYLGENRITHMHALDAFKGLPLVELFLTGNPLVSKIKDHDLYVRYHARYEDVFNVLYNTPLTFGVDGADLPPKIGFDVSDEVNLPSCRASFLCNPQGQDLIREFLKQYYAIYDSNSRQPLLEAYHENAMLSISINYGHHENRGIPSNRLNHYSSQNRNLNRLTDREGRRKLLKTGKLQVVSSLSDLPKTQHDLQTFSVDLTTYTPAFIAMTINGVFKETSVNITPKPLRSFHRTLIIVPNGSGFCVQNDLFFITNVTKEQEDASFKDPIIASAIVSPSVAPVQAPAQPVVDEAAKLQMVQALAQQSGMNIQWSTNCLEQTNWDYQRGIFIFNELQKEGKIPPEAFIK